MFGDDYGPGSPFDPQCPIEPAIESTESVDEPMESEEEKNRQEVIAKDGVEGEEKGDGTQEKAFEPGKKRKKSGKDEVSEDDDDIADLTGLGTRSSARTRHKPTLTTEEEALLFISILPARPLSKSGSSTDVPPEKPKNPSNSSSPTKSASPKKSAKKPKTHGKSTAPSKAPARKARPRASSAKAAPKTKKKAPAEESDAEGDSPANSVGECWAVHYDTAALVKAVHTFQQRPHAMPTLVLFEGGPNGLSKAKGAVTKHFAANKASMKGPGKKPVFQQPVYINIGGFASYVHTAAGVMSSVSPMPALVHTGTVQSADGTESVKNTWIWNHVESETARAEVIAGKATHRDTTRVLENMSALVTGDASGHAFNSKTTTIIDQGVALAALVVARFSTQGTTIWDLCDARKLLALPMAAVGMGRNYVCIQANRKAEYNKMVMHMQDIDYLKDDCAMLYDGRWDADTNAYYKLTVTTLLLPRPSLTLVTNYNCIVSLPQFLHLTLSGAVRLGRG